MARRSKKLWREENLFVTERKAISKKTRFEVFKRDKFTCQYCGRSAPDVILHIDHIVPISKGGDNDLLNLVTSCSDCNFGKKDRELSDDSIVKQQKEQLDKLEEKRHQINMMLEWQRGLMELDEEIEKKIAEIWNEKTPGLVLNDNGLKLLRKAIKKFGGNEVLESIKISLNRYLVHDENGEADKESAEKALDYIERVCNTRRYEKKKPYIKDLFYIRGIVRNRMYCNEWRAKNILEAAFESGAKSEDLQEIAKTACGWNDWYTTMHEIYPETRNF